MAVTSASPPTKRRPRFTRALLVTCLLSAPAIAQEPTDKPEGQTATPVTADFTGTWDTSGTIRRADNLQIGMRLQGVGKFTQEEDQVSGTTNLGGGESHLTGTVVGATLRLEGRDDDADCPGVFQSELTMSISGDLFTGWFSGQNCNGFMEATVVGRRSGGRKANRNSPLVEVVEEGETLLLAAAHEDAIRTFREALRRADEPSYRIQIGLARSYNRAGAFKDGATAARKATELAPGPQDASDAYFELGVALLAGSNDKPRLLDDAEGAFRQTLELSEGGINMARYRLGQVLLKLERDEEGIAFLEEFVRLDPDAPLAPRAQALIKNPRRARELLIPDFEAVTLGGRYLSTEDLENRVVLVDFWGTWCAPCVAAVPSLRRLSRKTASDPFVLLSISSDKEEIVLKQFIADEEMDWVHVWDHDRALAGMFEVTSYPTYFIFDPDGVFLVRHSGWSERLETQINNLVKKAIKSAKKAKDR